MSSARYSQMCGMSISMSSAISKISRSLKSRGSCWDPVVPLSLARTDLSAESYSRQAQIQRQAAPAPYPL